MKSYDSISDFVRVYFSPNQHGFDDWTIIKSALLEDRSTLLVSLANPLQNEFRQVAIAGVSVEDERKFIAGYRKHYLAQFENRFGFFLPEKRTGDVEYENYNLFYRYWIEADGKNVLPYNIPLLIDYPSDLEYAEVKSDGSIAVNYQRLLIIMAQPRRRKIRTIFVQKVTESDFEDIKETIMTKTDEATNRMF